MATATRLEALLHKAWRRTASGGTLVRSRSGDVFRVIYSGRPSDGAGPDFRDAVVQAMDGKLLRGDIEMHVRASDWKHHGHQFDPRYNGVMFHVASEGEADAITAAGTLIPLVILGRIATAIVGDPDRAPADTAAIPDNGECVVASAAPGLGHAIARLLPKFSLGEAGDHRFLAKSSGFQAALKTRSRDDVMWSAVLDGLGYARNRRGFRKLGTRLPWGSLASSCEGLTLSPSETELLLLWAAGLAARPPLGSPAGMAAERLGTLPGGKPEWVRAAGRPANHPSRRIAAAARLAHRWIASGGPSDALELAVTAARSPVELRSALVLCGEARGGSYLGPGRASTIVVNSVLPCLHAVAFEAGRWHLAERCLALYLAHPKLPENGIEREARRILRTAGRPSTAATARDQQGLLYLYRALTMQ